MIPFVLKQQMEEDPDVVRGYEQLWAYGMRVYGIYPRLLRNWYYVFGIYENAFHVIYSFYLVSYVISISISLMYDEMITSSSLMCLGVMTFIYCAVGHNFIYQRPLVDKMFKIVGQGFYTYKRPATDAEEAILHEASVECKKNFFRYNILGLVLTFFQIVLPPVANTFKGGVISTVVEGGMPINKNLPIPLYLPYSTETNIKYWITFSIMLQNGGMEAGIVGSACALYCNVCSKLCAQLDLLSHSLVDLESRAIHLYESKGNKKQQDVLSYYDDPKFHECMNECLTENIKHHQVLIEFYEILQRTVSLAIFGIFSGTALQVSAPMFQFMSLLEEGEFADLLIYGTLSLYIVVSSLIFLGAYCMYGQRLTDASERVNFALYEMPWVNSRGPFRTKMMICQSNTMKPFVLWAMGLISASNSTLMDIVKTTFTYFNLLMATKQ